MAVRPPRKWSGGRHAIRYAGEVAPVGEAWRAHFRSGSHVALHDSDGSHPRPEGSYLAAAVIAATIIDESPRQFDWYATLDEATARLLLETAERMASPLLDPSGGTGS